MAAMLEFREASRVVSSLVRVLRSCSTASIFEDVNHVMADEVLLRIRYRDLHNSPSSSA